MFFQYSCRKGKPTFQNYRYLYLEVHLKSIAIIFLLSTVFVNIGKRVRVLSSLMTRWVDAFPILLLMHTSSLQLQLCSQILSKVPMNTVAGLWPLLSEFRSFALQRFQPLEFCWTSISFQVIHTFWYIEFQACWWFSNFSFVVIWSSKIFTYYKCLLLLLLSLKY